MSVYVNIMGGLGNQMFQFAMGYAMARSKNTVLQLDVRSFAESADEDAPKRTFGLTYFDIPAVVADSKILDAKFQRSYSRLSRYLGIGRMHKIDEEDFSYNPAYRTQCLPVYINGYFQSEKYFLDYAEELRNIFLKNTIVKESDYWYNEIKSSEIPVSIHLRRGDYIQNPKTLKIHGICEVNYYEKAVKRILENYPAARFFVFSDDIPAAEKELGHLSNNLIFVEHKKSQIEPYDMLLMGNCKHNIIANSSYSWWGAWLNENPDKMVIAPQRWFADEAMQAQTRDLIPETWIRL